VQDVRDGGIIISGGISLELLPTVADGIHTVANPSIKYIYT